MPKLKNSLIAGALYISIITILYGFTQTMFKTRSDTFSPGDVEMQEMGSFLAASTISNTSSGSSWFGHPAGTLSGATHTTVSSPIDNISISRFSELDVMGYPTHDPRIDKTKRLWAPKHRDAYEMKFQRKHNITPSIGSSGELDYISMHSRSQPANQPAFNLADTVSTRGSIIVPRLDDPRYHR